MKTETLQKIKSLKITSNGFATFFQKYKEITSDPNCDKHHAGFTRNDDRFIVFRASVMFSANRGYYGNSGCSTVTNGIDSKVAEQYFCRAIEINKEKIFQDMADQILLDANELKDAAQKEVNALNEMLKELI